MSRNTRSGMQLSIVVPLFNEVSTIDELHRRLTSVLFLIGIRSEIIYVDDGSSDGTREALTTIADRDARVRVVQLTRNYGQTAALAAGFDAAAGDVIVAMDGDLQHEPEEIPRLLGHRIRLLVDVFLSNEQVFLKITMKGRLHDFVALQGPQLSVIYDDKGGRWQNYCQTQRY